MRLRAIRLRNVRRFTDTGVQITGIGGGVNVLSAANERGKSTCFDALQALFFLPHGSQGTEAKSLRPYAGGSPEISIKVETEAGLFRVEKKFFAGRFAKVIEVATDRVIAQADEAEAWIDELIRVGSGGPAGLLWVRQGMTGLEPTKEKEKKEHFSARQDLLSSVAGEVEALTGGRRMDHVLMRCTEELGGLVTATGKPKTGSTYKAICDQTETLLEKKEKLFVDLTALRATLDERRHVEAELRPLSDENDANERQKKVRDARSELDKAREHAERLKSAKTAEELAVERHKRAQDDVEAFVAQMDDFKDKSKVLKNSLLAEQSALKKQETVSLEDVAAAAVSELAENADKAARAALAKARAAETAIVATKRLEELKTQLKTAEGLRASAETALASAEAIQVTQDDVSAAEKLDASINVLKAHRDAAAVSLSVSYDSGAAVRFAVSGRALEADHPEPILAETQIEVDGIGRMTISPGANSAEEDIGDQVSQAEVELDAALKSLGVSSVAAARTRLKTRQDLEAKAVNAQGALDALAPQGLETLRAALADTETKAGADTSAVLDPEQAERDASDAEKARRTAMDRREETRELLSTARQNHVVCSRERAAAETAYSRADEALGPEDKRADRKQALGTAVDGTEEVLDNAAKLAEQLRSAAPDLETAEATLQRAEGAVSRAQEDKNRLEKRLAELNATINARADDAIEEEYEETSDRLEAAQKRRLRFETEVQTLMRLKEALETARSAAKEQYFGPVTEELRPLLSILYDTADVVFDDTSLLPKSLLRNGLEEKIDVLSGGTREQIAILTRLAFARLLAKDGRPTPVILDDALIYSDDDRIEKMFNALHRQARDLQIIVFTCRQRAFQSLGGHGLAIETWD